VSDSTDQDAPEPTLLGNNGERCAIAALRRGDPLFATAPPAARWLLVEHPGPWRPAAFDTSELLAAVAHRANAFGIRAALIRRPGRQVAAAERCWALVDARPGHEGSWWGTYREELDLLDVPLKTGDEASRSLDPIYLICTHGRHDPCCAIWGRPAVAALAAERPDATWECSHVGGDRFAANLVALPHGLYYGQATPEAAIKIAEEYESGQVVSELLRGRSSLPAMVQAAEHFARDALGERNIDALRLLAVEPVGDRVWRVRLLGPGGPVAVTVRATVSQPARLTCSARKPDSVRLFALVAMESY
jgi:hypothetical protein